MSSYKPWMRFSSDPTEIVGVLTGRGGVGKPKLFHDWVQTVDNRKVLYVMEDADWHSEVAKEIPAGDLLIAADDALRFDFLDRLLFICCQAPKPAHKRAAMSPLAPSGHHRRLTAQPWSDCLTWLVCTMASKCPALRTVCGG